MNKSAPPRADEFEISVVGPGKGECVVLHLGDNEWCIVDSCIPQGFSESIAVDYLRSFQNGALDRVRLVVATHWHDDHIRGLASLLQCTPRAEFYCSVALKKDEFLTLVGAAAANFSTRTGVDEFATILGLSSRAVSLQGPRKPVAPKFAMENRLLLEDPSASRSFPIRVWALSPSDATLVKAHQEIAEALPKVGQVPSSVIDRSPNHNSVVLWVEAGPLNALLGADLEHTGKEGEGWSAVVQCHQGHSSRQTASYFKIPHHGSKGADSPAVWEQMLVKDPIAVVTPFNSSKLPRESDLTRLGQRTSTLYCSAMGPGKARARDAVVEKIMKRQAVQRKVIQGPPGHVRVRWPMKAQTITPNVELFHGAYKV